MIRNVISSLKNNNSYRFATTTFITNQYNFYVDFKGLLYFDDGTPFLYPNCIKDVKFITQLYRNMKLSEKQGYSHEAEFWGEKNFVRSAISPVIYNYIDNQQHLRFSIEQKCKFQPTKLELDSEGRIWHPFKEQIKGVFSNDLTANCLQEIRTVNDRVSFKYKGEQYEIKKLSE